jgi:Histidine kinase-, DNA gyrase B-, and HSP90-like ATPase
MSVSPRVSDRVVLKAVHIDRRIDATEHRRTRLKFLDQHRHQEPRQRAATKAIPILVVCILLWQMAAAAPVKEIRRVLIFYELGLSSPAVRLIDGEVRAGLGKSPYQIQIYAEYLETTLFPDEASQRQFRASYIRKYREHKPDLIIAVGPSPIKFMVDSHERYFKGTPIVICGSTQGFCQELSEQQKLEIDFTHSGIPRTLPQEVSLCLFRVLQEALHNAAKYSGVRRFEARLRGIPGELELTIRDCGRGFDPEGTMNGRGLGLISMRERVSSVRGAISISSKPMCGTEINVRVPNPADECTRQVNLTRDSMRREREYDASADLAS